MICEYVWLIFPACTCAFSVPPDAPRGARLSLEASEVCQAAWSSPGEFRPWYVDNVSKLPVVNNWLAREGCSTRIMRRPDHLEWNRSRRRISQPSVQFLTTFGINCGAQLDVVSSNPGGPYQACQGLEEFRCGAWNRRKVTSLTSRRCVPCRRSAVVRTFRTHCGSWRGRQRCA